MARLKVDVLTQTESGEIEAAAFQLLEKVGVSVEHERATAMMPPSGVSRTISGMGSSGPHVRPSLGESRRIQAR
ncbi:MAG: hypothetical protein PHW60_15185 [Kiritimatiellae bacterium]|nr:hypothetical protein [Kiritimatiellia bacterium]